ncbi:MFS transporter [Pseudomonas gingeri]|uniref:MFS transporter n=1 Tax=Pseudomonas gingeri TaxID=117681 RepID=A0A7Y8CLW8_9PSED|nr:MFS transporter [Pseudomonas gingeri]NWB29104.1 MFS transporter [Pseudomonas gingeri]NWC34429.1 MFS transporter [Pseudomonas gingeri]NWD06606.1 MFS transporter [Pseudomonas gingeri]NWD46437.1 MFS transporter [Pseudomonas gingeri]NWE25060.1 MFS transporter [Pseudomonas gingeri]
MTSIDRDTPSRDKLFILAAICLSALVLPLSFTGGAVATPAIGRDLGGSPVALTWITNAFMLSFGSLLMAAGALADVYGRKRLFTLGMLLFTAASVAQSLAPSVFWLDVLRAVQGVAGAAALASGSAALAQEFEGHARTRAFSMLGTTFGIGLAFGPLVAGVLIEAFSWRAIFVFTAVIGVIAMLFGLPRMRETRDPDAMGLDWPGTVTFSAVLALFTFGVIQAPDSGWGSPLVVGLLAASALLLVAFVMIEMRVKRPMLDLTLLRFPRFVGVQMLPIGTCYCYIVLVVMLPLRFIGVEGLSEIDAGLLLLALSAPMLVVPMLAASLTRFVSAGILSGVGFLIAAVGLHWLSLYNVGEPKSGLVAPMLLIGIGAGLPWGLMDGLSVSVVPKERAGMAAGIFNTVRVAGEGIALASVAAMLASLLHSHLSDALQVVAGSADAVLIAETAHRVTTGDMAHAINTVPGLANERLVAGYAAAFQYLLHILTLITLAAAAVVLGLLSKDRAVADEAISDTA